MHKALDQFIENFSRNTKDDPTPIVLEMIREVLKADFLVFCKYILGYKDITWETHSEIIQACERLDIKRKLICVPRGSFKSTIAAVCYPIWRLIKNPDLRILIDSELFQNSKTYLRESKSHMQSEKLIKIFGRFDSDKWNESEVTISQRQKKHLKEASITVGGIGTTKVGQHYDLIIGDDYNSPKNSNTQEKCQKVIDHIRYNLNILDPEGEYMFIGTRYAERDTIGFILKDILDEPHLAEGKMLLNTKRHVESGLLEF